MGHELVALFAGGIQAYRIVDLVVFAVGNLAVKAVHRARRGEYEVFDFVMAAGFQNVQETDQVALQVGIRIRNGVAYASLCGEVHDLVELFFGKELVQRLFVVDTHFYETAVLVLRALNHGAVGEVVVGLFNAAFAESTVLEAYIVIVINIVEAHHFVAAFREHEHELRANKTCSTSNKNLHVGKYNIFFLCLPGLEPGPPLVYAKKNLVGRRQRRSRIYVREDMRAGFATFKLMSTVILFNKPFGVLSQFTPESGHAALDTFGFPPGVYAAGRLDHDSEGALLLTDNGKLIKKLLDPKFEHPRTYLAQVDGQITEEAVRKLAKGVDIKGYHTKPCKAEIAEEPDWLWPRNPPVRFRANIPTSWVRLTLIEGKNRQVRHMTAAVGFPTLRLIRVQIGNIPLGDLKPGEWRVVTDKVI